MSGAIDYQRRLNLFWASFFAIGGLLCVLSITVHPYFSVAVVAFAFGATVIGMRMFRCPRCGKLVTDRKVKVGRFSLPVRLPLVAERVCSKCGFDLRGQVEANDRKGETERRSGEE